MTKAALFTAQTGVITPGDGDNSVTVADWDTPVVIGAEFSNNTDFLVLKTLQTDGTTYGRLTVEKENNLTGSITLSRSCNQVTLITPGTYALSGDVLGSTTGFKITV